MIMTELGSSTFFPCTVKNSNHQFTIPVVVLYVCDTTKYVQGQHVIVQFTDIKISCFRDS